MYDMRVQNECYVCKQIIIWWERVYFERHVNFYDLFSSNSPECQTLQLYFSFLFSLAL